MFPVFLLAAGLFSAQVSIDCANPAAVQTEAVPGLAGVTATLQVSSTDDHSKNAHLCWAEYRLLLTSASSQQPRQVDLLSSDGDWGRPLAVRLSGFSQDGKRIFGVLTEGGVTPSLQLFDYNTADGSVRLVDLGKLLARISGRHCRAAADVVGTTASGAPVLDLTSDTHCLPAARWWLTSQDRLQPLSDPASVLGLYK